MRPPKTQDETPLTPEVQPTPDDAATQPFGTGWGSAGKVYGKTLGYLLPASLYGGIYFLVGLLIIGLMVGGAIAFDNPTFAQVAAGGSALALVGWIWFAQRKLFAIAAGHVALLDELLATGDVQTHSGRNQFAEGRHRVREALESNVWALHSDLDSLLSRLTRSIERLSGALPFVAGLKSLGRHLRTLTGRYLESVILFHGFRKGARGEDQFRRSGAEAAAYVLRNPQAMVKTALIASAYEAAAQVVPWLIGLALLPALVATALLTLVYGISPETLIPWSWSLLSKEAIIYSLLGGLLLGIVLTYFFVTVCTQFLIRPLGIILVILRFEHETRSRPLAPEAIAQLEAIEHDVEQLDSLTWRLT